jgi:hypothetical protein
MMTPVVIALTPGPMESRVMTTRVAPSGRGPWSTIVLVNHRPGSRGRPFLWPEPREVVSFADEQASHSPTVTRLRHGVHLRPRAMQVRRSGHA